MKKLSFIMAVLMILMCMPVMAMTSISAVEETLVDLAIPSEWSATEGEGEDAVTVWPTVAEADAIGYVLDNGVKVYVDTWTNLGAVVRANKNAEVVFYLVKDVDNGDKRIGTTSGHIQLDITGGKLTIDGSLGKARGELASVYEIKSSTRVIHFENSTSVGGRLTLKDVKINCTNTADSMKGIIQINQGGPELVIEEGTDIRFNAENGVVCGTKLTVNGGHIYSTKDNSKGAINFAWGYGDIEINGGKIECQADAVIANCDSFVMNGGEITVKNFTEAMSADLKTISSGIRLVKEGLIATINGGTVKGAGPRLVWMQAKKSGVVINGGFIESTGHTVYLEKEGCSVVVNGGTVNTGVSACLYAAGVKQNITVNGGFFTGAINIQANNAAKDGTFNIYGGTFTDNNSGNYCITERGANTWNIYGGTFVNVAGAGTIAITGSANVYGAVVNIYGGSFKTTGKNATNVAAQNDGAKTINIYGGSFSCDNGGTVLTITGGKQGHSDTAVANKIFGTVNVYDGNFVVKNFVDGPINSFTNTTPDYKGTIYASNGSALNIYGGNFALYKDNGITPATEAAIVYGWSTGSKIMHIYGGTFTGGKYAYALVAYSGKAATSADKTLPFDTEKSVTLAYPEGELTVSLNAPVVQEGASVRLDTANSGLRFTSRISSLTIDFIKTNLAKEGTELTYGTMIVPSSYVKYAGGELTMEAFDKAGKTYLNIEAKDGIIVNEDGSVTINAAVVNIKKENYDRDFIAVSYIKYIDTTGAEVISYANNVNLAQYSRNVEEIAYKALADVLTTSAGTYTNKVDGYYVWNQNARKYEFTPGVAYSRYNAEQIAVLKSYIIAE